MHHPKLECFISTFLVLKEQFQVIRNLKSYIFQIHIVYTELERYLILDKIFCDETQDDLINTNWYPLIFLI